MGRSSLTKPGFALVLALAVQPSAQGLSYVAPIDRAAWSVEAAPRLCRLRQNIPRFGDAVFESRPGADERFFLATAESPLRSGPAQLAMVAPPWNPGREGQLVGPVQVSDSAQIIIVEGARTQRLLEGLKSGLTAELRGHSRLQAEIEVRINATPVYFRRAFEAYRGCVGKLPVVARAPAAQPLPVVMGGQTFGDLAISHFEYGGSAWKLSLAQRGRLDQVAHYLKSRRDATRVAIDGYGGDSHRRLLNLEFSRKRAQAVADYLRSRGVADDHIVMRFHGDQQGAKRLVLIRLERAAQAAAPTK